jgi:hypothetical protein
VIVGGQNSIFLRFKQAGQKRLNGIWHLHAGDSSGTGPLFDLEVEFFNFFLRVDIVSDAILHAKVLDYVVVAVDQ